MVDLHAQNNACREPSMQGTIHEKNHPCKEHREQYMKGTIHAGNNPVIYHQLDQTVQELLLMIHNALPTPGYLNSSSIPYCSGMHKS